MPMVRLIALILMLLSIFGAAPEGEPLARIAILADIHIGDGPDDKKVYSMSGELVSEAVRRINSRGNYDAVLIAGDLTKNGAEEDHRRAVELLDELEAPWYVVPGNHEVNGIPNMLSREGMDELWGEHNPGPGLYFEVELKPGLLLLGLDSTIDGSHGGAISPEQMDFLDEKLHGREDDIAVLFFHHNVINPLTEEEREWSGYGANLELQNSEEMRELFGRLDVELTVSGHSNLIDVERGSGGAWHFVAPAPLTHPSAFSTIEIYRDGFHLKIEELSEEAALKSLHGLRRDYGLWKATAFGAKAKGDPENWNRFFPWEAEK
jgi:hypothetical protein